MPTDPVVPASTPLRVLVIEDYEEDALLLRRHLARAGYDVDFRRIETAAELRAALNEPKPWDLALADYTLPSFGARDALSIIQQHGVDLPFIIVSGTIDEVSAVSAMRAGAHDYVLKGHLERLLPAIERELSDAARRRERLHTEAELRLAQQRFSATFNQAAVGMAHTAPDGHFILVNQRLAECLAAPLDTLLSMKLHDFLMPSENEIDAELYAELLAGKRNGYRVERTIVCSDGSTLPAQLTVSMLVHDGDRSGTPATTILWVVEDISARKVAERETADLMQRLINSERLAAAGRMANTLAHEINNPLEALTNIFFLLQEQMSAQMTEQPPATAVSTQENLTQIQELLSIGSRELERVGHITRSTLSFYRKVPGRTLDLLSMLQEVVQLFSSRAGQHQVELATHYGLGLAEVHFDPALRQVFANLVANALEAMGVRGGSIHIRARVLRGIQPDDLAVVTIADTGHGIDPSNLACIFEPFFTTKGERGTGLGLWVTRGIVEEHRGKLQLRSSTHPQSHGTVIRIVLPIQSRE
jgi:PAS domain S-box-containing protein